MDLERPSGVDTLGHLREVALYSFPFLFPTKKALFLLSLENGVTASVSIRPRRDNLA